MSNKTLTSIFGRFAGREVNMIERPYEMTAKFNGKTYKGISYELAENNPVVAEIQKAARENGLMLLLLWPGAAATAATRDHRMDRLNASVEKESDGKWRIQPGFRIG